MTELATTKNQTYKLPECSSTFTCLFKSGLWHSYRGTILKGSMACVDASWGRTKQLARSKNGLAQLINSGRIVNFADYRKAA